MFTLIALNPAAIYRQRSRQLEPYVDAAFAAQQRQAFRLIRDEGYQKIGFREAGDALVIDVVEKDFPPRDASQFNYEIVSLVHHLRYKAFNKVVLNFGNVEYMNAAGLGCLVPLHNRLKRQGGKLEVCSMSNQLKEVMEITHLDSIISINESEPEALKTLQAA